MDILKRLSEYNPPDRVNDKMMQEIAIDIQDAKNEIERLREALGKIADYETEEDCPCAACEHAVIARSALQQKDSE